MTILRKGISFSFGNFEHQNTVSQNYNLYMYKWVGINRDSTNIGANAIPNSTDKNKIMQCLPIGKCQLSQEYYIQNNMKFEWTGYHPYISMTGDMAAYSAHGFE